MGESDDLAQRKAELCRKFLGTAGIHGIGISRGRSALTLFVDSDVSVELRQVLPAVRVAAAPLHVLVVPTSPKSARLTSPTR